MSDFLELYEKDVPFETLKGKTLKAIDVNADKDRVIFIAEDGSQFLMYHSQDCCESVSIEDTAGDLSDLIGNPILLAEEIESKEPDEIEKAKRVKEEQAFVPTYEGDTYYNYRESETWTFYKLSTIKGSVTFRWYGSSNGYYSESVSFAQTEAPK